MTRALVPFGEHHPHHSLPDEVQAILEQYEVPGAPELSQELARILALDHGMSERDPHLSDIRKEQIAALSPIIEDVRRASAENEFFLGFLLLNALTRHLYTYVGYQDFGQWCADLGMPRSLVQRTMNRARTWPYLYSLGYPLSYLMEPGFEEEKIPDLIALQKRQQRELEDLQRDLLLSTHEEFAEGGGSVETAEGQPLATGKQVRQALSSLSGEEQQEIVHQSHQQYIERMRQQVEEIRRKPLDDYLKDKNSRLGKPEPLFVVFLVTWQHGTLSFAPASCECGFAQIAAMKKNQANWRFRLPGEDTLLTLRELGDCLDTQVLPPWTQQPGEEGEDHADNF